MSSHPGGDEGNGQGSAGALPSGPGGRQELDPEEADLEREARAHVSALRGFYGHAAIFVAVNLLLLAINLLTDPRSLWFFWPLLGWGIGLSVHAVRVFAAPRLDRDWEARKIAEYKNRARARRNG